MAVEKEKAIKNKVNPVDVVKSAAAKRWYNFVSSSFSNVWKVSFWYDTMYEIQKLNPQAQSAKDLIIKMIGKRWVLFSKNDILEKDVKWAKIIKKLFTDPSTGSWKNFKDKYYTNYFGSWMATAFYAKMGDWSTRIQMLDSRYIDKELDAYWNIKKISYNMDELVLSRTKSQIIKYDPDKIGYWMSIYTPIVYDALSDREASKRNYMFFKNGAVPNVLLRMADDIENEDEINSAIDQFEKKYMGTDNSHGVFALWWVQEVKTLDISNKDIELLELKKFSVKVFGMIFHFDPRFLSFRDGENGSHSEYAQLAIQSDKSMQSYADVLEEFMLSIVKDIHPDFPYDEIVLVNDTFLDEETKIKIYKDEVQNGFSTPEEIIKRMWKPTKWLWDEMKTYYMNIQYNSLENIINESKSRVDAISNAIEQSNKEEEKDDKAVKKEEEK